MAKRKDIEAILEDESLDTKVKVTRILDLVHTEVDTVKDERDKIQEDLNTVKKDLEKAKSDKEKAESDLTNFKNTVSAKDTRAAKEKAYAQLLEQAGVDTKHHKLILRATDLDKMEIDSDGKLKDADKITESIKSDYADYVSTTNTSGAKFQTPPSGGGSPSKMSKDEIMKISDTSARQKAILENHELFGI